MKKDRRSIRFLALLSLAFLFSGSLLQIVSRTAAHSPGSNPAPKLLADITSRAGITVGGAIGGAGGQFTHWGGSISVTAADAVVVAGNRCAFNISYDMVNQGTAATATPFKNVLRLDGSVVSTQTNLSLAAGATQQINTQAYLNQGSHVLSLTLDNDHVVPELNEANNVRKIKIRVSCNGPRSDITSQKGITIGGAIGGAGGQSAPWGGAITLSPSDAFLVSNGTCAFNISYDMENIGAGATNPPFLNRIRNDATIVSIQSNLSLAAGATQQINTQAYLSRGSHVLSLSLDNDFVVSEANEANNVRKIKLRVNCP